MKPQFPKLRVKIKSLAYEAQAIRKEERRTIRVRVEDGQNPPRYEHRLMNPRGYRSLDGQWHIGEGDDLYFHRIHDVRREQRATLIAYGFLRGVPMADIEAHGYQPDGDREQANWKRVLAMVEKYGPYNYTKESRDKAWADIVAWRAVPTLPRETKAAFRPRVKPVLRSDKVKSETGAFLPRVKARLGGEGDTVISTGAGGTPQWADGPTTCPALLRS